MARLSKAMRIWFLVALTVGVMGCRSGSGQDEVSDAEEPVGTDPRASVSEGAVDDGASPTDDAAPDSSAQAEIGAAVEGNAGSPKPRSLMEWTMLIATCKELTPCLKVLRETFHDIAECIVLNFTDFWFECRWPCRIYHFTFGVAGMFMDDEEEAEMGEDYLECLSLGVDKYFVKKCS